MNVSGSHGGHAFIDEGSSVTVTISIVSGSANNITLTTADFIRTKPKGYTVSTSPSEITLNETESRSFTLRIDENNRDEPNATFKIEIPSGRPTDGNYRTSNWRYLMYTPNEAYLTAVDNDISKPPPLEFAKCNTASTRLNGAPTLDLYPGGNNGGEVCYKVRLSSEPIRSHVFYATVKQYRTSTSPIGISGKDVYLYGRGNGRTPVKRWNYEWNWSNSGQFLVNNYGQTHHFTADNWDEWVTIGVRCCRYGVEVNRGNQRATIYHYVYDNLDREGSSGQNATIDIFQLHGQNSPAQAPPPSPRQAEHSCVSDAVLADVQGYAGETWRESSDHVERWSRVLAAFGENNSYSNNPMTATEAQTYADRGLPRWVPVVAALECLETAPEQQPEGQPAQAEAPPPTPEISINAGNDVTEGGDATFTVTASPAPASDLDVTVTISQSGDFATTGSRTVTISTTGSATFTVTTTDDSADEPDGSVTATLSTGAGYSLSSTSSTATVAVSDNDDAPPPPPPAPSCVSGSLLDTVRGYYDANKDRAPGYGLNWKRVLIAFGDVTDADQTAFTAAEAKERESRWFGWKPITQTLECIEAAN